MATPLQNFSVSLRQTETGFIAYVAELSIFVEGPDVEGAYERLAEKVQEAEAKVRQFGLEWPLPSGGTRTIKGNSFWRPFVPFCVKAAVVALVGAFLLSAASISFNYAIRDDFRSMTLKAARTTIQNFAEGLEKGALKDIPPHRQERIKNTLRRAVPVLKPYFAELRPLFVAASSDTCPQ